MTDKRMYFIRNNDAVLEDDADIHITEHELFTDIPLHGILEFDAYKIYQWDSFHLGPEERRRFCLRIINNENIFRVNRDDTSDEPYYFGGGIGEEITAILSVLYRARFELGHTVRWNDEPNFFEKYRKRMIKVRQIYPYLMTEIKPWIEAVKGLEPDLHNKFIMSARFYQQALLLAENHPDIAYLNLVSAIEVLSSDFPVDDVPLEEDNSKLADAIEKIENIEIRNEVRTCVLRNFRRIRRRFIQFILEYLDDAFWNTDRPERGKMEKENLKGFLGKIYDQRSATLHSGESFPPWIFHSPDDNDEIPIGSGFGHMERTWTPSERIPYLHFFERLVNRVITQYVYRNQISCE